MEVHPRWENKIIRKTNASENPGQYYIQDNEVLFLEAKEAVV